MSAVSGNNAEHPTEPSTKIPKRLSFISGPALMTAVVLSLVLLSAAGYAWYAIGATIRAQVSWSQMAVWLFLIFLMIGIMLSFGYSHLWADDRGVTVRNGPRLKRHTIESIAGVRLRKGDAWGYLLIKKPEGGIKNYPVLAIQSAEGNRARRKVNQLRAWLKAHGATSRDLAPDPSDTSESNEAPDVNKTPDSNKAPESND